MDLSTPPAVVVDSSVPARYRCLTFAAEATAHQAQALTWLHAVMPQSVPQSRTHTLVTSAYETVAAHHAALTDWLRAQGYDPVDCPRARTRVCRPDQGMEPHQRDVSTTLHLESLLMLAIAHAVAFSRAAPASPVRTIAMDIIAANTQLLGRLRVALAA